MLHENYLEKVYAGFLGMNVGIRLGAPLEPTEWTFERILQVHGDIKGYVKDYNMFSADDDANGPLFFIRALYDDARDREVRAEDVGKAWLNYCREGIGMIWWGGEGISTEHNAYLNLKNGIQAPKSGSVEQNGIVLAEQIGGQILIDSWGLIYPQNVEKAAHFAEIAASVSHDKEGLYGARFMAACISKAFTAASIREIIDAGLSVIPKESVYARIVNAVLEFYLQKPDDFRECRNYLEAEWGYDKYPGICHIIPNAGVCILALLYGNGDFARTIEIATMCAWDTDCNAGNVGTITGVYGGIEGIPLHYRKPVNDCIVASSVSGYLNIVDIPTFSAELALLGYKMAGEIPPENLQNKVKNGEVFFDFELPGSTHGFKSDNPFKAFIQHNSKVGQGSLEVIFDRMYGGSQSKIFYKPFYRRDEFNDEKYKPTFAPKAYSGQQVAVDMYLDKWQGSGIFITPYIRDSFTKECLILDKVVLENNSWNNIQFTIPDTNGALIDEIGYILESPSTSLNRAFGAIYLKNFHIFGNSEYTIDFSKQSVEFLSITPFAHQNGKWSINGDKMRCLSEGNCSSYTGNYYTKDAIIEFEVHPISGTSHQMIFRAQGIQRHYLVGFDGVDKVSLILNDFGYERLITVPFTWEIGVKYRFQVQYKGKNIRFSIDDETIIEYEDDKITSGMIGIGCLDKGEVDISSFIVKEVG
ncbi:ADP-ribosylglycohydrolase family protein [Psychrobacillus sp. INOP01]|uniref:ADP-ribosylglycohydrolase family protein n=1 Tax=Psychrobacillus sp. INOP01 TaxID=2829187 RepID=UPI001BA61A76|nr:ADP-ribosylglycohydrolase family protein [Psychrobacillus sp. INOP01]QUG40699.1 ADP-ribosylglycohydrolase family protein [Psychrobacillus sp. INOP01]